MRIWPFAMTRAVYIWNHLPGTQGLSSLEIYTETKLDSMRLQNEKAWGYHVYVLEPKLWDGKKLPKWDPRRRRRQYLGISPSHTSTVGLIHNITSGYISPQFHVVYDCKFQTVMGGYEANGSIVTHIWESMVAINTENIINKIQETHGTYLNYIKIG